MTYQLLDPSQPIGREPVELRYLRIANEVFGTPLLLAESQGLLIGEYLAARMTAGEVPTPQGNRFVGEEQFEPSADGGNRWRGYAKINNVARVGLMGELVNRGAWMGSYSGMTSYEGFEHQMSLVEDDPDIDTVVLDVNSPGGAAGGMIPASRTVRRVARRKRVVAVVNSLAASACYGVISGASEIVATEDAELGSIGVLLLHFDRSKRLEDHGVRATIIHAGKRKVDGNPFGPLEGDARAALEARVDGIMDKFVGLVSEHREISAKSVRDLEAAILSADQAVAAGLADRIGTFDSVLSELTRATASQAKRNSPNGGFSMSETTGAPTAENAGISQADHDAAVAAARSEGEKAGASAAVDRFAAILGGEGIRGDAGRMAAALDLAVKSPGMSAEDVTTFVTANVAAAASGEMEADAQAALERERQPIGLAQPSGSSEQPKASLNSTAVYNARRANS